MIKPLLVKAERFLETDIRYLLGNGFWVALGQGVGALCTLASAVAFAHFFTPSDYGTYKYIFAIIGFLTIATLPNMITAVIHSVARGHDGAYIAGMRMKLRYGIIGALGGAISGGYYLLQGNTVIGFSLIALGIALPFLEALTLWSAIYNGKKLFRDNVLLNTVVQVLTSLAIIAALYFTQNILLVIGTYIGVYIFVRYIIHWYTARRFHITHSTDVEHAVEFGKKLSFTSVFAMIADQVDIFLLWHFFGAADVGVYAFALATTTPVKTLMKTVMNLAFPKFAEKESALLRRTVNKKVVKAFLLFVPLTVLYITALPYLYRLFFPTYADTVIYAQALGLIFLFFPLKLHSLAVLTRMERSPIYRISMIGPLVAIVLMCVVIPRYGIWGAVGVQLAEYVVSASMTYYFFRQMR